MISLGLENTSSRNCLQNNLEYLKKRHCTIDKVLGTFIQISYKAGVMFQHSICFFQCEHNVKTDVDSIE